MSMQIVTIETSSESSPSQVKVSELIQFNPFDERSDCRLFPIGKQSRVCLTIKKSEDSFSITKRGFAMSVIGLIQRRAFTLTIKLGN